MTGKEHAEAIRAAIQAARDEGYLIDWDFYYIDWWGHREVSEVVMGLYRSKRGADGVMRVDEQAEILSEDI